MSEETNNYEDYQVLPLEHSEVQIIQSDALERANVDIQVATAKRYPRDMKRSIDNSIFMATMDVQTAQTCGYVLPRGGKQITGPSVHLAKILVSNWGNMRTEAKVVQITDKQVISRGVAWDLETNVASAFEVRRSIIDSKGRRFNDDMITVTGNAANAIAYRNAVFSVIPKAVSEKIYQAAQRKITGDLSTEEQIIARRTKCLEHFKNEYNITEEEVLKLIGKQTVNQIRAAELAVLIGINQSLSDGDTTVDTLLKNIRSTKDQIDNKKEEIRSRNKQATPDTPAQDNKSMFDMP